MKRLSWNEPVYIIALVGYEQAENIEQLLKSKHIFYKFRANENAPKLTEFMIRANNGVSSITQIHELLKNYAH